MAWNEPGGGKNNNQDPWRGKNDQGPPDLDEIVKKLQDRFGGLFGGGKKDSNSDGGGFGLIAVVVIIALFIWGFSGFYRVEQAESALVLRFGETYETNFAGWHWNPPLIDTVLKVDVIKINSLAMNATMLTEDQNLVAIELDVQYKVVDPERYFLQSNNSELALAHSTESALRHVVGGTVMDQVITEGRKEIADNVQTRLQEYLETYKTGLLVTKVNIKDSHPPDAVKAAFDDVIKAKEDESRLQNEAQTYANGIIPEARGQARRMEQDAAAYKAEVVARANGEATRFEKLLTEYQKAPEVTRQRLYLETMEQVYGATTKIMVDVEGGNNMMYLPLDKLMAGSSVQRLAKDSAVIPEKNQTMTSGEGSALRGLDRIRQVRENRRWESR